MTKNSETIANVVAETVANSVRTRMNPILQGLQEQAQKVKALPEKADQILLGLTHSGAQLLEQTLKKIESNPNDLIGRVSRSVLERAQSIRSAIESAPLRTGAMKSSESNSSTSSKSKASKPKRAAKKKAAHEKSAKKSAQRK